MFVFKQPCHNQFEIKPYGLGFNVLHFNDLRTKINAKDFIAMFYRSRSRSIYGIILDIYNLQPIISVHPAVDPTPHNLANQNAASWNNAQAIRNEAAAGAGHHPKWSCNTRGRGVKTQDIYNSNSYFFRYTDLMYLNKQF